MSKCLGVIYNCDHVLKQNENLVKSMHFSFKLFIQIIITKKVDILGQDFT
jgi:hypothetical protein